MTKTKWIALGALVVLVALSLVLLRPFAQKDPTPVGKLSIGVSRSMVAALPLVADAKGFFAAAGLDVTLQTLASGKQTLEALARGEVDVCTSSEFVALLHNEPEAIRVLASVASSDHIQIVGNRERGIITPADLADKRIGVTRGTAAEYFLGRFLAFNNVKQSQVEIVDIKPPQMAQAIADASVDAVIVWPPVNREVADQLADNASVFPAQNGQSYYFLLLTSAVWVERNPDLAHRLLGALIKTEEWIESNPDEAQKLVSTRLELLESDVHTLWRTNNYSVSLPQSLLVTMEAELRWASSSGLIRDSKSRDFGTMVDTAPLEHVKPSAVGLFR